MNDFATVKLLKLKQLARIRTNCEILNLCPNNLQNCRSNQEINGNYTLFSVQAVTLMIMDRWDGLYVHLKSKSQSSVTMTCGKLTLVLTW